MTAVAQRLADSLATFDWLPDAVIAADDRGRIVFINAAGVRLLQWSPDELCGQPLTSMMPARMRAAHEVAFNRYIATGHSRMMGHPIRVPAVRKDGSEVEVELLLGKVSMGCGATLFVGTLRQLADRFEVERQLRVVHHLRAVTAAGAHLTAVLDVDRVLERAVEMLVDEFDAALARVWLKEPHAEVLRLRASAGLSRRTSGSAREHIDIASHPFKVGVVARTRRPFAKNGLVDDGQFNQEWVQREGMEAAAVFPLLVGTDLLGVLVAFFRKRVESEVFEILGALGAMVATAVNDAKLYADAQRALRARDDVLAIVSHDLRGPLSVIDMGSSILLRKGNNDNEDLVRRMKRAGQRMSVLIRDLLDVSAIEAGKLRMEPSAQVLGPLIAEAIEMARPLADEKHIGLTADGPISTARVLCDRERIVQLFGNLLGNAIKFTGEGGAVNVHVEEGKEAVKFAVTDTGRGMASEELAHIFDRYWQVGRPAGDGVGLGLAIAKGIVEAHQGTIRVESTPGQGSRFTFDLPRAAI